MELRRGLWQDARPHSPEPRTPRTGPALTCWYGRKPLPCGAREDLVQTGVMRCELVTVPGGPERPNEDWASAAAPASGQGEWWWCWTVSRRPWGTTVVCTPSPGSPPGWAAPWWNCRVHGEIWTWPRSCRNPSGAPPTPTGRPVTFLTHVRLRRRWPWRVGANTRSSIWCSPMRCSCWREWTARSGRFSTTGSTGCRRARWPRRRRSTAGCATRRAASSPPPPTPRWPRGR